MGRPKGLRDVLLVVLFTTACAPAEQPLVQQFFDASRLRDKTALQKFSTVIFEPAGNGIVRAFTVTNVSPERREGARTRKDVAVSATVTAHDGGTMEERLTVTLERAEGRRDYPWVVVGVRDAAGRSAPPL